MKIATFLQECHLLIKRYSTLTNLDGVLKLILKVKRLLKLIAN